MISKSKIASSFLNKVSYSFSSVQFNFPEEVSDMIYKWGKMNIPNNILSEDGRENLIHVTVKYGLHNNDPFEFRELIREFKPVTIRLGKISLFSNESDVIKIGMDSPELHRMNKLISDALPHTDTYPDYIPHCTIAYVKKGEGKKFDGNEFFNGMEVVLDDIVYSGNDNRETHFQLK